MVGAAWFSRRFGRGCFEAGFLFVFSLLVWVLFFLVLGSNGLVLGNDSAVHLQRAELFLGSGRIPVSDVAWIPPLFHALLAVFLAFTGASGVGEALVLLKAVVALVDWLVVFSVWLVAERFFGRRGGVLAGVFVLLCFPLFEMNCWAGYTGLISLAFMFLALMFLAWPSEGAASAFLAFLFVFSTVMAHQLAAFLLVFVAGPFVFALLVRRRGRRSWVVVAAVLGAGLAFLVYYLGPIWPYMGELASIVFFQLQTMLYQVPMVSFESFLVYFGFLFFMAFAGLVLAFNVLRRRRLLGFYVLLASAFLVPLFFSQSYLVGLYLPYHWFVYYMLPALAVFAAVSVSWLLDYAAESIRCRRSARRVLGFVVVIFLAAAISLQVWLVTAKTGEAIAYYATSDLQAYDAAVWLQQCGVGGAVVVSEKPGHWFAVYSGREVIAETNPVIEWNARAECVLDLSYELENPLTMLRVYESRGSVSQEYYALQNMAWKRVASFLTDEAYVSYRTWDGALHVFALSGLNRTVMLGAAGYPRWVSVTYSGENFTVTQTVRFANDSYDLAVSWQLSAVNSSLNYATLYVTEHLDPASRFSEAFVPGVLDWVSPWSNASYAEVGKWAVAGFSRGNFGLDRHVATYDARDGVVFALEFEDLPDAGNVGVLADGRVDAVRWQYQFYRVDAGYTVTVGYRMLVFSRSSYAGLQHPSDFERVFAEKLPEAFTVKTRNFASVIRDNDIAYLVYDRQRFDLSVLRSGWLDLAYANAEYVVLKVKLNHPYAWVFEAP
jgi:hypothetical protein